MIYIINVMMGNDFLINALKHVCDGKIELKFIYNNISIHLYLIEFDKEMRFVVVEVCLVIM